MPASLGQPSCCSCGIAFKEERVSELNVQKYALLCLRLAAECRDLAADVPEPDLRAHFLRMASIWMGLTDQLRVLH
jgi:hypothetical protein